MHAFHLAIALIFTWIAIDQIEQQAYGKRHSFVKRAYPNHPQRPDPTAKDYYDSLHCPKGFSCVEVSGLPMWYDKHQAINCSTGGGFTCTFPANDTTVTVGCGQGDGSSATIHIRDWYTQHKRSEIVYSETGKEIYGTFGTDDNEEKLVTYAMYASAFVGCENRTELALIKQGNGNENKTDNDS